MSDAPSLHCATPVSRMSELMDKEKSMLSNRETTTLLAALRFWQQHTAGMSYDQAASEMPHFESETPLLDEDIGALCEKLNTADDAGSGESGSTYTCMVLSTAHITEDDDRYLRLCAQDPTNSRVMGREEGYFIKLYSDPAGLRKAFAGLSDEGLSVLEYCLSSGCRLIEIDRDVDPSDQFPVFDW